MTVPTTALAPAPVSLGDDVETLLDSLTGFHPGTDLIVAGLRLLATSELTADQTQSVLAVLGGDYRAEEDLLAAVTAVVLRLTDPATNRALRPLPGGIQRLVAELGRDYADEDRTNYAPRYLLAETSALIYGA
ncbi:MAG: hypothetical protein HOY76_08450 [Streptomyces sp.]|nr:hypothetical protein [Streptomyces sp.]